MHAKSARDGFDNAACFDSADKIEEAGSLLESLSANNNDTTEKAS